LGMLPLLQLNVQRKPKRPVSLTEWTLAHQDTLTSCFQHQMSAEHISSCLPYFTAHCCQMETIWVWVFTIIPMLKAYPQFFPNEKFICESLSVKVPRLGYAIYPPGNQTWQLKIIYKRRFSWETIYRGDFPLPCLISGG
jgi:hypothetical protein